MNYQNIFNIIIVLIIFIYIIVDIVALNKTDLVEDLKPLNISAKSLTSDSSIIGTSLSTGSGAINGGTINGGAITGGTVTIGTTVLSETNLKSLLSYLPFSVIPAAKATGNGFIQANVSGTEFIWDAGYSYFTNNFPGDYFISINWRSNSIPTVNTKSGGSALFYYSFAYCCADSTNTNRVDRNDTNITLIKSSGATNDWSVLNGSNSFSSIMNSTTAKQCNVTFFPTNRNIMPAIKPTPKQLS